MIVLNNPEPGNALDARMTMYPSCLEVIAGSKTNEDIARTTFGFVVSGRAAVKTQQLSFELSAESYFCIPGGFDIDADGIVVLMSRIGYRGLFAAGSLEKCGRLSYLNGCSSTILVAPPRRGDPIFNHLHIPNGVAQTPHTHPTLRLGVVARGNGLARGYSSTERKEWSYLLTLGCVFHLPEQEVHSFYTTDPGQTLDIVTLHPDSDWGPTDDEHPMKNQTLIGS